MTLLARALLLVVAGSLLQIPARNHILLHRVGPAQSELFLADGDGSNSRRLLNDSALDYNASISADGEWVIFTSERGGSADIWRVRTDGSGLERLTDDPAYEDQASISPTGDAIAFVSTRGSGEADIWILELKSKRMRNLTRARGGDFRPSWSPDGQWIAFSSDRDTPVRRGADAFEQLQAASVYVIGVDGRGLRRITAGDRFAGSPKWSPDAKRLVFYELNFEDTEKARSLPQVLQGTVTSQIVSVDVHTGERVEHTAGPGMKVSPQFLPDGIGYLVKGPPRPGIAFIPRRAGAGGYMRQPSWSVDGRRMVYQAALWPPKGKRPFQEPMFSRDPTFDMAYVESFPAYARDGRLLWSQTVADPSRGAASGEAIFIIGPGEANARQLFFRPGSQAIAPQWSPDGRWIVFALRQKSDHTFGASGAPASRIMVMRDDGTDAHEVLPEAMNEALNTGFPSWSPDGTRIVYRVRGDFEQGLRIVELATGRVSTLTDGHDNLPAWSPTGDRIVFTGFRDGDYDIFTIRPDGRDLRRLTTAPGNDAHAVWSPDGEYLLFSSSRLGYRDEAPLYDDIPQPYTELFIMKKDGSGQRPLTDNQWEDGTPAWRPPELTRK